MEKLSALKYRFVIEYCKDQNGTQAAIRAGYAENSANEQAARLLAKDSIKEAIAERLEDIAVSAQITSENVLRQWWQIATADPNEIMQLRKIPCRYCHGVNHKYQWTEAEYMNAVEDAINRRKPAPDGIGGFGYSLTIDPHPECPECSGMGDQHLHINDTRRLKGAARRLYAGAQKTKDGIKILTRNQDAALDNIAKYLGMVIMRGELSAPGGKPLIPESKVDLSKLSVEQLEQVKSLLFPAK